MLDFHLSHEDMILAVLEEDAVCRETEVKSHIISQIIKRQIKRTQSLPQRLALISDAELRTHILTFF